MWCECAHSGIGRWTLVKFFQCEYDYLKRLQSRRISTACDDKRVWLHSASGLQGAMAGSGWIRSRFKYTPKVPSLSTRLRQAGKMLFRTKDVGVYRICFFYYFVFLKFLLLRTLHEFFLLPHSGQPGDVRHARQKGSSCHRPPPPPKKKKTNENRYKCGCRGPLPSPFSTHKDKHRAKRFLHRPSPPKLC